jgi:hypothetical protein
MCIICIEYQKQLLTAAEARRNLPEVVTDPAHLAEVEAMLDADEPEDYA